jgi:hypothetical protein
MPHAWRRGPQSALDCAEAANDPPADRQGCGSRVAVVRFTRASTQTDCTVRRREGPIVFAALSDGSEP